ncbi:LytR/AlgR family response regulator transcription factor [Mucilaginibacter lutimaris]|uniref:LytR/AlgR family response regulator transcription factor n=1 Tax=Mucilaginibacter lutimaris TaxID=931629 RepID=A0ABW2ZBE3_9SPHI
MLSCYIIDDEEHPVELLKDYISRTPDISLAGFSLDPVLGLHEVLQNPPDILFLDVDMPVLSGFDLYDLLSGKCTIVFTTAFPKYAVDAYNLDARDFLLKPIRYERFLKCLQKIGPVRNEAADTGSTRDFIFVQTETKSKLLKIRLDDIYYIEGLHNYVVIHTSDQKHIVYMPLKDILEQLPEARFCRIHRSFIINYSRIKQIEGNRIFLEKSPELTVGPQYREAFFDRVKNDQVQKKL